MRIIGRVQGVHLRDSRRQVAARLGVNGWSRNNPDGADRRSAGKDEIVAPQRTQGSLGELGSADEQVGEPRVGIVVDEW